MGSVDLQIYGMEELESHAIHLDEINCMATIRIPGGVLIVAEQSTNPIRMLDRFLRICQVRSSGLTRQHRTRLRQSFRPCDNCLRIARI